MTKQLPEIYCPACKETVTDEGWWEWAGRFSRGDTIACPKCGAELRCVSWEVPPPLATWEVEQ